METNTMYVLGGLGAYLALCYFYVPNKTGKRSVIDSLLKPGEYVLSLVGLFDYTSTGYVNRGGSI
jgi:hypothetical protein